MLAQPAGGVDPDTPAAAGRATAMTHRLHWKNLPAPVRIALGAGLVGLGIVGLFLPFLQGLLFITLGLMILARDVPWVRRGLGRLRQSRAGRWVKSKAAVARRRLRL